MRRLWWLLALGCAQQSAPPLPMVTVRPVDIALPQSPSQALADYRTALASPPAPLVERDGDNRPLLYYGRVFVQTEQQLRALDVLAFAHDRWAFFDDYDATKVGHPVHDGYQQGNWEYAIATGVQWNLLIKFPGIVAAVQINPRLGGGPHPALDSFLGANVNLDLTMLAKQGFHLPTPPTLTTTTCSGSVVESGTARRRLSGRSAFGRGRLRRRDHRRIRRRCRRPARGGLQRRQRRH